MSKSESLLEILVALHRRDDEQTPAQVLLAIIAAARPEGQGPSEFVMDLLVRQHDELRLLAAGHNDDTRDLDSGAEAMAAAADKLDAARELAQALEGVEAAVPPRYVPAVRAALAVWRRACGEGA